MEAALIPNPIHKVLSTFQSFEVRALLMGGQACVFYDAAEFSRDTDFAILADPPNLERLAAALRELRATVIEIALAEEERVERAADRVYWTPLKRELERMRHSSLPQVPIQQPPLD